MLEPAMQQACRSDVLLPLLTLQTCCSLCFQCPLLLLPLLMLLGICMQNFARPLRISIALAMAPAFDLAITRIGQILKIDKKWAFGVFLLCMGVLTSTVLFGTIFLLGGFPTNPVLTTHH
jgi:hypothetical protein